MDTKDENTKTADETHRAFCAELSMKLRSPLNAILGYAELLALQPGARGDRGDVHQILKSARELLAVIECELGDPNGDANDGFNRTAPAGESLCDVLYVEDQIVN